ncbi:hypothetical protein KFU94_35560 [Chloroflexi bacterium TSY]|nr:hypothetical protein [Chloroflexi bacterium TSY]
MAKYNILTTSETGRLIIQDGADESNQLLVGDIDSMKNLIARLDAWRKTLETDGHISDANVDDPWINTPEARKIAEDAGFDLASTTITRAVTRGNLGQVRKDGGRWAFRRSAFETWFEGWKRRTGRSGHNQS